MIPIFSNLKLECDNYFVNNKKVELSSSIENVAYTWGYTPFETFKEVISKFPTPKRFIVFGCSIGYQCFFWNNLFPDVPTIGIDLLEHRVEWGLKKIKEYNITNTELIIGDILDFELEDGDLVWQNDLLIPDELIFHYTKNNLENHDVDIISYKDIFIFSDDFYFLKDQELFDKKGCEIKINHFKHNFNTSWSEEQNFHFYERIVLEPIKFDVSYIHPELIVEEKYLSSYEKMNKSRKDVKLPLFRSLYNKNYLKNLFKEFDFKTPETYIYSEESIDTTSLLKSLNSFVAKPAHMSESFGVIIKKETSEIDLDFVNTKLNEYLQISDFENFRNQKIKGGVWWKETNKGFIVEEYIPVKYELKVFVIWGEPFIGDLRTSKTEFSRVDIIHKKNRYLNWNDEYEKIKKLALHLKVDFFRIDFLYDGQNLYASELAFMPGTFFSKEIEEAILKCWRQPYFQYYYPNLC